MDRSQIYSYLTFILAIFTIVASLWSIIFKANPLYGIISMCLMLVFNHINKKVKESKVFTNEQETILGKEKNKSEEN